MSRNPPRYDVPNAAPEPLRGVQLLVNTWDDEHGREVDETRRQLLEWLRERGVDGDVEVLRPVREPLRALLIANNEGEEPPRDALRRLNAAAAHAPLAVRFEGGDAELAPADPVAAVLSAAYHGIADGTWPRLKACRNCHWAFYDASKNRSATWCSMQLCGNRLKTKRFRSRRTPGV
jgi:predicted RNA-binding Zn ribbon-like protein